MAPRPINPAAVNPQAEAKGGGIGVVLAGRMARRSIPPDVLVSLVAAHFSRLGGAEIFLLGGQAEQPLARRFEQALPTTLQGRLNDLTGRTALTDLPPVIAGLDLLITPDTGLMHLGAHLGTPLEALFLSSAWCWETGPYGLGHSIRQAATACAPCLESAPCPYGVRCLEPFKSESLVKCMAGKEPARRPVEMLTLHGRFDALGLDYHPAVPVLEQDTAGGPSRAEEQARSGMRHLLADYLNLPGAADMAPPLRLQHALQEQFFRESDWLLPRS